MDFLHQGELAAIATACLWTVSSVTWTLVGRRIGAIPVSFIRLLLVCPMFVLYGGLVHERWFPLDADAQTWILLALSGFCGFFICDLCLFKSFLLIGTRLTLLIHSLTPPLSAILAWIYLGERLQWWQWLGMAVTLSGVAWVVLEEPEAPEARVDRTHFWRGVLLVLVAVAAAAVGYVLTKEGMGDYEKSAASFIRILGGLVGYLAFISLLGRWPNVLAAGKHGSLLPVMIGAAFVGPFLGITLLMVALYECPTGVVVTIISTMPVLILPFSIFLFREKVSPRAAGGAVLSFLGVALLVWGT